MVRTSYGMPYPGIRSLFWVPMVAVSELMISLSIRVETLARFSAFAGQAATFDLGTGRLVQKFPLNGSGQVAGAYGSDGALLFAGSISEARLWSADTGQPLAQFPETWVRNAEFRASGDRVLVAASTAANLWDIHADLVRTFNHG